VGDGRGAGHSILDQGGMYLEMGVENVMLTFGVKAGRREGIKHEGT
jgi:hypothetical protein